MGDERMDWSKVFTEFAKAVARTAGKPLTFGLSCLAIIAWATLGPVFGFSDTWQLVINTSTTIITFLMVFVIQNTQNRDSAAIQAKLDELLRSHRGARNEFIGIENLTDDELGEIIAIVEKEARIGARRPGREGEADAHACGPEPHRANEVVKSLPSVTPPEGRTSH